jgi:very-short-patch-repair endonuclease
MVDANRKNSKCSFCRNSGENNPMFGKPGTKGMSGKKQSLEFRKNLSERLIGKPILEETKKKISFSVKLAMKRPDVKQKIYDSLSKTKYLKVRTDKGQLELLKRWNALGFNFEPNYQLHTNDFLYYVDGYDKEKNVVLEYDGKYHRYPYQQKKDLVRQQQIISFLNPKKFWRYNSETKQFADVL